MTPGQRDLIEEVAGLLPAYLREDFVDQVTHWLTSEEAVRCVGSYVLDRMAEASEAASIEADN